MSYVSPVPRSWADLISRLAYALGGREDAVEWLRQALVLRHEVESLHDLRTNDRRLFFQTAASVLLLIEDDVDEGGDLAFALQPRLRIARAFQARLDGLTIEGPAWSLSPIEAAAGRPSREAVHGATSGPLTAAAALGAAATPPGETPRQEAS